ncbi:10036_t:CDS:2 [Acaulospora colombiana]|uniref:10036_t:CDS:1 n=1 Tax=Acaulospora colombiana TaxID=27376 RepID=A0ACA9NYA2_9GLOM|nr:10036_t:CDS:2 [Acaulospora colombiana]
MSFGRPGSGSILQVNPPDRGSFPLDHDGMHLSLIPSIENANDSRIGECKEMMMAYLKCLKENKSTSTPCRTMSKTYLDCRMKRGLMQQEEWEKLGLGSVSNAEAATTGEGSA